MFRPQRPVAGFGGPLFFFNDPATTEIYTLSLHDALPISNPSRLPQAGTTCLHFVAFSPRSWFVRDRKSTRLNFSHGSISDAVFCLKKNIASGGTAKSRRRSGTRAVALRVQRET